MSTPQPDPTAPPAAGLDRALALVRFLRANCPWDAAQTPASVAAYLLEEAHEAAWAATAAEPDALREELGDALLTVAFLMELARERGWFAPDDVVAGLEQKMRRRHPHLHGDGPAVPWAELKARERAAAPPAAGALAGLPGSLDPLLRAHRTQEAVARVGFEWASPDGALAKAREELDELAAELAAPAPDADRVEDEAGDLLFAAVNLARLAGAHPAAALARANAKFARRFAALEAHAADDGVDLPSAGLDALRALWRRVKDAEQIAGADGP